MTIRPDFAENLIVMTLRTAILLFAMKYVGFNPIQGLILTVAIVMAMEIK